MNTNFLKSHEAAYKVSLKLRRKIIDDLSLDGAQLSFSNHQLPLSFPCKFVETFCNIGDLFLGERADDFAIAVGVAVGGGCVIGGRNDGRYERVICLPTWKLTTVLLVTEGWTRTIAVRQRLTVMSEDLSFVWFWTDESQEDDGVSLGVY
ncbi:hypothetical protein WA026_014846 [Henosepilachna vigintioctopunctata]|uniref:Uncharacterized protein n=1 Tax=Henosepilachna vigintioctopunctata TaxID=420089 RepID=A0AAW1UY94_9CUCU